MRLNYFPIKFDFENYHILATDYADEKLTDLREKYNDTHSFFRNEDHIYISNKEGQDIGIGNTVTKNIFENKEITLSLIKHLFFRTFRERFPDLIPVDFYPFRFFSRKEKDDIIYDLLPFNLKNKIAYKKLIEIQLRYTEINGVKQFGFLINIRRNWLFKKSCLELNEEGYELEGIEVIHSEILPGLENVLAPNEEFVGVIESITDCYAFVKTINGVERFGLKDLFIRKTKFNIGSYLSFAIGKEKSQIILDTIERKRSEVYHPKKNYEEIKNIANTLFNEKGKAVPFLNKDGFLFIVDSKPLKVANSLCIEKPTFIFDMAKTKTVRSFPDKGLINYGPYDSIIFDIKTPRILGVCHKNKRGLFTRFLKHLKEGLPQSNYFKSGFKKKYNLTDIKFSIKELSSYDLSEYSNILSKEDDQKPDLAIIEIPEEFKRLPISKNPYYEIKAKLLALEIPVQFINTKKIEPENEFILNTISLQMYAKMGGTPWVLPAQRSVDREIIIGIGHSWIREFAYAGASQNKVVGITTFMSGDGQYLLGEKTKDVAYEDYFEELIVSLRNSVNFLSKEQGWTVGETIRLIFHIFKPLKNIEFEAISQVINNTKEYRIKFAFVTIGKYHPISLFDPEQKPVYSYKTKNKKGAYIPLRGSNVFLDEETAIVQMYGANELKSSIHGMSKPIQIKIRKPTGKYGVQGIDNYIFSDLSYVVQQVYTFTYLSWRSFLPSDQPATMIYSNLISSLLGKMREIQGWDPDVLNYNLKRKKWFL